ncbi:MAG TPA: 6-phosphogluconolactonase [Candidatus Polarisedimenticolia bacterium]|nr:6-phosphogluconolactonase [Candidatus Polarisedimenticolia bacterium]
MPTIRLLADAGELARAGAGEFARLAREAIRGRGAFRVALSGGSTPRLLYTTLAGEGAGSIFRSLVAWEKVHLFWGDERAVPPDHPDSNYRMACETLLSRLPVPAAQVHRIRGELPEAAEAAADYERTLVDRFKVAPGSRPRFDLVLLGLGADGHTASLFPGSEALRETTRLVAAPWIESLKARRITLTLPVLNNAACVLFLVAGEEKAAALRSVLSEDRPPEEIPARGIRPAKGSLVFLVDRAAARLLPASLLPAG